jgi:hypothetical protein
MNMSDYFISKQPKHDRIMSYEVPKDMTAKITVFWNVMSWEGQDF